MNPHESASLPGFKGISHVAIPVWATLLEEVVRFFERLGFAELYRLPGPPDTEQVGLALSINQPQHLLGFCRLRGGNGPQLELLVFDDRQAERPARGDGAHLALYVQDIFAAVDFLRRSLDLPVLDPQPSFGPEAGEGAYYIHVPTPLGVTLKLVSYGSKRVDVWNPEPFPSGRQRRAEDHDPRREAPGGIQATGDAERDALSAQAAFDALQSVMFGNQEHRKGPTDG